MLRVAETQWPFLALGWPTEDELSVGPSTARGIVVVVTTTTGRDEHEGDDQGWMARWLDRSTWDRRVTPNVIKRTGERRTSRGRPR